MLAFRNYIQLISAVRPYSRPLYHTCIHPHLSMCQALLSILLTASVAHWHAGVAFWQTVRPGVHASIACCRIHPPARPAFGRTRVPVCMPHGIVSDIHTSCSTAPNVTPLAAPLVSLGCRPCRAGSTMACDARGGIPKYPGLRAVGAGHAGGATGKGVQQPNP